MKTNVFPTSYFHGKTFNYAQNFYEMKWSGDMGEELFHGCWDVEPVEYWF